MEKCQRLTASHFDWIFAEAGGGNIDLGGKNMAKLERPFKKTILFPEIRMQHDFPINKMVETNNNQSDKDASAILNENPHLDVDNLNCNLCQRHFNSKQILLKHVLKSKLHSDNLTKIT